jgi:hypothetical protein
MEYCGIIGLSRFRTVKMMSKRKKLKKVGSTTRNIHKIATTLGVIPLVASSFLFTDSYALASTGGTTPVPYAIRQNKTLDLGISNHLTISMSDLFESSTISNNMLTGSFVVTDSGNLLTTVNTYSAFSSSYFSAGGLVLQADHQGSYTVTVKATNSATPQEDFVEATFTVGIIDSAIVKDKLDQLDGKHNGFDIMDVINAVQTNGLSTDYDTNGDQVIDKADYAQYLSFIPAGMTNHSPVLTGGTIPTQFLALEETKVIDLDDYFMDEDENSFINYRFYTSDDGDSQFNPYFLTTSSLHLSGAHMGSSPITIVADDHKGGTKVVEFNVEVFDNHAPEINEDSPLYDLVMETGSSFHKTSLGWFTDSDVGTQYNDHLRFTLGTSSYVGYTVEEYSATNLLINAIQPTSAFITLAAVDDHNKFQEIPISLDIVDSNIIGNNHIFSNLEDLFYGVSSANEFTIVGTSEDEHGAAEITLNCASYQLSIANKSIGTFTVTVKAESTTSDQVGYKTFVVKTTNPLIP